VGDAGLEVHVHEVLAHPPTLHLARQVGQPARGGGEEEAEEAHLEEGRGRALGQINSAKHRLGSPRPPPSPVPAPPPSPNPWEIIYRGHLKGGGKRRWNDDFFAGRRHRLEMSFMPGTWTGSPMMLAGSGSRFHSSLGGGDRGWWGGGTTTAPVASGSG